MPTQHQTAKRSAGLAASRGSTIPYLEQEWVCQKCGNTAANSACIRPISEMDCSERDTLEVYGVWQNGRPTEPPEGMFTNGKEIEICGDCGHAYWKAPNDGAKARGN